MNFFIGKQRIGKGVQLYFASPLFFGAGLIGLFQMASGNNYLKAILGAMDIINALCYLGFIGIGIYFFIIGKQIMVKEDMEESAGEVKRDD